MKNMKKCVGLYITWNIFLFLLLLSVVVFQTFASLVGVSVGIESSVVRFKNCAITAGINNFKSIIKKKRKKHDKIVLFANTIKVLISEALINQLIYQS